MRSTLDEFLRELAELTALVDSIDPVNKALVRFKDPLLQQYVSIRRRFDYAAFVVGLYSSFEKFIEELIAEYARLESGRVHYEDLPDKLKQQHLSRTAEMLVRGRIGEGRYVGLTELEVVKNLFECLNGIKPYKLNKAAIVAHDANLRVEQIDKLFAAIGIEQMCQTVRRADPLLDWYKKAKELDDAPTDGVSFQLVEARIKDIVERRNQIAHNGGNPTDLLGNDGMRDVVAFMEAFSRSIFNVTVGSYLQAHHAAGTAGRIELKPKAGDGPYKNGTVVVVDRLTHRIFVGQPVFIAGPSISTRWGRIQGLQQNDAEVQEISPDELAPEGVGIKLNFKCPKGATLSALEVEDPFIWSFDETDRPLV